MYLGRGHALSGTGHGEVNQTHVGSIVALKHATPESSDRANPHYRTTEDDDRTAKRVEGPKGNVSILDATEVLSGSQILVYFEPEVAKTPESLPSSGGKARSDAPRSNGKRGGREPSIKVSAIDPHPPLLRPRWKRTAFPRLLTARRSRPGCRGDNAGLRESSSGNLSNYLD